MRKLKGRTVGLYALLAVLTLIYLFPIAWVSLSSFKSGGEMFRWPPSLLPQAPTLENYTTALSAGNFALYF